MQIKVDPTQPPPWTGLRFRCVGLVRYNRDEKECGSIYQLEAADKCELRLIVSNTAASYNTPRCLDCGYINVIEAAPPPEHFRYQPVVPPNDEEAQFPS
jgi:hypothetical protein